MAASHPESPAAADAPASGTPAFSPLYQQIKGLILQSLQSGEWKPGEAIPSEMELAARFRVSQGTVRKAIDELAAENLVVRRQGKGTFVPDLGGEAGAPDRTHFYFFHIARADGLRETPRTELLDFRSPVPCPAEYAALLGIEPDAPMHRAQNLQYLQDRPVMLDEIWVPATLFPGLDEAGFAGREGTVYGLYQRRFGLSVVHTEERLRAERASPDIAALLDLPAEEPVLRILRIAHAIGDRPVELRLSWVDTRRHEYWNSLA